ncbi:UNVERIFIED_CONTAM: hypothetical protein FKN15_018085 [Acipenser sinensis]
MDDVSLICTNTSSVPRISNILEKYCTAPRAVINKSKSEVYMSKNWQVDKELSDMYPVKKDKIKILGLIFKNSSGAQSWMAAINQVRKKIGGWSTRSLTMTGRVLITKFADMTKMTAETVLYGPAGGIATSTAKCVWRINVVKQILWEGRNVCVYHKQELDTITTTRRAQTLIKDFVILDIQTLGKDKACADWRIVGLQDVKME